MALVIREALAKDVDVLSELILALAAHQNAQQYVLTDADILREYGFCQDKKFGALVAEIDGAIIGYLTFVWNYSTWQGGRYMFVENIFVMEQHRRLGAGVALMQEAKVVCKKNGCLNMKWEVQSDNENAIALYKNLGANIDYRGVGSFQLT